MPETVKNMFSQLDWSQWLYGLLYALIGGGSTAVCGGIAVTAIDADHFKVGSWNQIKVMLTMFLVSGVWNMFGYLKQHPLPEVRKAVVGGQN